MARPHDDRTAFRCSVSADNASAKLKIARKLYEVTVLDTSRNGFTLRLSNRLAAKLSDKKPHILIFGGETWEIIKKSTFSDSPDFTNVGFIRGKDLTKHKKPPVAWWPQLPKLTAQTDPVFLMFLITAFLFSCIALPGIGDKLGTAPRIQKGVHNVMDAFKGVLR